MAGILKYHSHISDDYESSGILHRLICHLYLRPHPAYFPAKSPVSAPSPVSDASYSQKLKSSPEFQRFQVDFTLRSQDLKNCFDAYLSDGGTVNKEELLSKTISLVSPKQTTLDVFDMLHNMRQVKGEHDRSVLLSWHRKHRQLQ